MNQKLYVFVEGKDDERLMKTIIAKCHSQCIPKFYRYINSDSELVVSFIEKLRKDNDHYVFLTDLDYSTSIAQKKKERSVEYCVEEEKVIVVQTVIESWYAAGAKPRSFDSKGLRTEEITKQKFDHLIGGRAHHSQIMEIIADDFDTSKAIQHSKSFKYFYAELKKLIQNKSVGDSHA